MPTKPSPIRVLLVDDHEMVRLGVKTLLEDSKEIEVAGEAASVSDAVSETNRLRPNVVLMDIRLPDGSGFEACRKIRQSNPETRVIFLTAFADDQTLFEGISSGADGYLLKEIDRDHLQQAITKAFEGQSVLDPSVTKRVMERLRAGNAASPEKNDAAKLNSLSPQEGRILVLVAEGKTNKEIGVALGLSDKTVKNYFSNVLDKLKFSRRSQAVAFYIQQTLKKGES